MRRASRAPPRSSGRTRPSAPRARRSAAAPRRSAPSRDSTRTQAATVPLMDPLDTLGRPLRDLRISVTDRCNFRCVYCMPKEVFGRDYRFLDRSELLTFEELERLARVFVAHGVEKIRITGGEPLVRREGERLVQLLSRIDALDLTMTTNGALLPQKARG